MEEENEEHTETETEHTLENNGTDTPNSSDEDSNECNAEDKSDTEISFNLSDYELVVDSTSEIEDGEEEVFDVTSLMDKQDTQYVLETQFHATPIPLPPAPTIPQPSSPSTDIIDFLMADPQPKEEKEEEDEEKDILEELMFGPSTSKEKKGMQEKERHCKTCTCFEN